MTARDYDLIIRAGRLFCAATGQDGPGAVAVRDDRIAAAGPDVAGTARETLDFPDDLLLPGLVDLHTHPGPAGWKYGIDADRSMLARGTTTVLSQGDAGAVTWPQYQAEIIAPAQTRIRLAINLARLGESRPGPCFQRADDVDVDACVAAIEAGGDPIWGIALNLSTAGCVGLDPREVLRQAITAAERTNRPLLYGLRRETTDWPHWSLADQLERLRPGDVVTYCFHPGIEGGAGCIVRDGRVLAEVRAARERGILFDVGHGMASLDFSTAEAALADGFPPRHDLHRCLPAPSRRRAPTRPAAHDLQTDRRRHGRDRCVGMRHRASRRRAGPRRRSRHAGAWCLRRPRRPALQQRRTTPRRCRRRHPPRRLLGANPHRPRRPRGIGRLSPPPLLTGVDTGQAVGEQHVAPVPPPQRGGHRGAVPD